MKSRKDTMRLAGVALAIAAAGTAAAACSSSNSNPTPLGHMDGGLDSSVVQTDAGSDANVSVDSGVAEGATDAGPVGLDVASDAGTDSSPAMDSGSDSSPTTADASCNPSSFADAGCTPCGTDPLYACPAAALGIQCIPFTATVPDAGTL